MLFTPTLILFELDQFSAFMNWNGLEDLSVVLQFLRFYLVHGFK